MKFKFLEHTADIKFKAFGKSLEKVFENSAYAMIKSMTKDKIKKKVRKRIKVRGSDLENLMYNFLEELLFLFDSKHFVLSRVEKIKINKEKKILEAELVGDLGINYEFELDVKAVTYNEMFVHEEKGKWVAQVVLDV